MTPARSKHGAVFVLPDGGSLGGVTSWGITTMRALARYDWRSVVVGPGVVSGRWPDGVTPVDAAPSIEAMGHGVRDAISALLAEVSGRVVVLPQLSGDAYAGAIVGTHEAGHDRAAVLGWMHADIRHDVELIRRFMPALAGVVCVSHATRHALSAGGGLDQDRLWVIPTGCEPVRAAQPAEPQRDTPLRLLYVGRLDAYQKRALSLPLIVKRLNEHGIYASLTIAGDGPAMNHLAACVDDLGLSHAVRLIGPVPRDGLPDLYRSHDMLVQPSRSEGLGLARIEAAMHGCVPVVTPGGSSEGIDHGVHGIVAMVEPDDDDANTAERFASEIGALTRHQIESMSSAGIDHASDYFSFDRYAERLDEVLSAARSTSSQRVACGDIVRYPQRAASFTLPGNFADRLRRVLPSLLDREIAVHGAGTHTVAAWETLVRAGVRIGAIADDDPQRWGTKVFGVPIVAPHDVPSHIRTVLLSTWLHEDAVWARRSVYEERGIEVIRLYANRVEPARL